MDVAGKSPAASAALLGLALFVGGGFFAGSAWDAVSSGAGWDDAVSTSGPQIRLGVTAGTRSTRSSRRRGVALASTNRDQFNYGAGAAGFGVVFLIGAGGLSLVPRE